MKIQACPDQYVEEMRPFDFRHIIYKLYKSISSISPIECVPLEKVTNNDSDIVIGRRSFPLMMTSFQGPLLSVLKVREGSKSCRLHSLHATKNNDSC